MIVPLSPPPDFVHGQDGLGNTRQPEPSTKPQDPPAARFLADMAKAYPGQITILAIGRLTNLAEALKLDSRFARNIREVVLMGGALYVRAMSARSQKPTCPGIRMRPIWSSPRRGRSP
jgi:purine nucleosidase